MIKNERSFQRLKVSFLYFYLKKMFVVNANQNTVQKPYFWQGTKYPDFWQILVSLPVHWEIAGNPNETIWTYGCMYLSEPTAPSIYSWQNTSLCSLVKIISWTSTSWQAYTTYLTTPRNFAWWEIIWKKVIAWLSFYTWYWAAPYFTSSYGARLQNVSMTLSLISPDWTVRDIWTIFSYSTTVSITAPVSVYWWIKECFTDFNLWSQTTDYSGLTAGAWDKILITLTQTLAREWSSWNGITLFWVWSWYISGGQFQPIQISVE